MARGRVDYLPRYACRVIVNCDKELDRLFKVRNYIKQGLPKMGYGPNEFSISVDKENKQVIVEGVMYKDVESIVGSKERLVKNIQYEIMTVDEVAKILGQMEIGGGDDELVRILEGQKSKLEEENSQLKRRVVKVESEYRKLEEELKSTRVEVSRVIQSKRELKSKMGRIIEDLEKSLKDLILNPPEAYLHALAMYAEALEENKDKYRDFVNAVKLKNELGEDGLELVYTLKEILGDELRNKERFEDTVYYQTKKEEYEKAKSELDFLRRYEGGKEILGIPPHIMTEILEKIDKEKDEKIVSEMDRLRNAFEILKRNNIDPEELGGEEHGNIPYLILLEDAGDEYRIKVVTPVVKGSKGELQNMILTHLENILEQPVEEEIQIRTANGEYTLLSHTIHLSKPSTHRATFKKKGRDLKFNLEHEDTDLKAGFSVKAILLDLDNF